MESTAEREELRLKIKKLKYKIEKEEKIQSEFRTLLNRLKKFNDEKLTIERVFKKISFLLEIKGLTLTDWFMAYPYDEEFEIEELVKILEKLGVKLPRDEKGLLINFIGDEFPQEPTIEDFKKVMGEYGLHLE